MNKLLYYIIISSIPVFFCQTVIAKTDENKQRSFKREADPIIISSKDIPSIAGTQIANIGCFRSSENHFETIPCQIDERLSSGNYIFPYGPESNKNDGDNIFNNKDELVFMAHDTGEKTSSPMWSPNFLKGAEIEIKDPINSSTSYVYVASFLTPPPKSAKDYVQYKVGEETVDGSSYTLGFSKKAPIVFDKLILKKSFGGSGDNPIDRMKIRLNAKVWSTIPINKTEEDYTSKVIGYIDGPVRVIRRTRNRMVLFWKIPSPSAVQDNFFYDTLFEFPIVVSLPFDLDAFLSFASLRISVDLKGTPERLFTNPFNTTPIVIDGINSNEEKNINVKSAPYSIVYGSKNGESAGFINRLTTGSNTKIDPLLYYHDDTTSNDAPESVFGQVGNIGYQVKELKGLKKGTHYLTSVLYTFPKYVSGIERLYLQIKDTPLTFSISKTFEK